jgi:hypothetical protein
MAFICGGLPPSFHSTARILSELPVFKVSTRELAHNLLASA